MTLAFSVIIPMYNSEVTIERCLESVFAQSRLPDEVIVIDDCSTDKSAEIVRNLISNTPPCFVKIISPEKNGGPARARNLGAQEATCSFLAFLDSDDYWCRQHLETAEMILASPESEMVITGSPIVHDASETFLSALNSGSATVGYPQVKYLSLIRIVLFQRGYCTPSLIVRRSIFQDVGGFPVDLRFAEDLELFIKLRKNVETWISIEAPRTTVVGKHLWLSGSGLSSHHWQMFIGTLTAVRRGLDLKIYQPTFWLLVFWFTIKFFRRLIVLVYSKSVHWIR